MALIFFKAHREYDKALSKGLVFAHPSRLKTLLRRGHLVVMDATHHTNELKWQLYSVFVRNECGIWCPAAHMLTEEEDSDIVAAGLCEVTNYVLFEAKYYFLQIRKWCHCRWFLRYMLTDDSAGEQCAVRKTFPSLQIAETEVTYLLCRLQYIHAVRLTKICWRYL